MEGKTITKRGLGKDAYIVVMSILAQLSLDKKLSPLKKKWFQLLLVANNSMKKENQILGD